MSVNLSNLTRSKLSKISHIWEKKTHHTEQLSIKDLLLKLSFISPKSVRPFWRATSLKPDDCHELLLGFKFHCGNTEVEAKKVGLLWKLFNWAPQNSKGFEHSSQSYTIMASMLARVELLDETGSLLRVMGDRGVLLGCDDIFHKLIEGYCNARELENAVSMYNLMRRNGLFPSELCFRVLLDLLAENRKTQSAFRVCMDMFGTGVGVGDENMPVFESVVKLLCRKGRVKDARSLVRKLVDSGLEPSRVILNLIANGYSEKKDFDDLLNFLMERKGAPDVPICHKILSSQCRNFGPGQAYLFMKELESLGFTPDEVTFCVLISWSCREGKLKDAFIYLSEIISRGLKPNIHCYNALISGVFKKGMWQHAGEIFQEMVEREIKPDVSTFRVLLAGYCKFRHFEEVKAMIIEMVNRELVQLSPLEDPLSKAFSILGFKPSAVKVMRDNDVGLQKAEFFDCLGNGLYLETDKDEYDKVVMGVLEDAMASDFNSLICTECSRGNIKMALMLKDTMLYRGQKFSLLAYSALLKSLCGSRSYFSKAIFLYEENPELVYQLGQETSNLFIRMLCKKGVPHKGRVILEGMLQRDLSIENDTYSALIIGLCRQGSFKQIHKCFELAQDHGWFPSLKDCKSILEGLCQKEMLKEVLELLEHMIVSSIHSISDISNIFLEVLCGNGHASIGRTFFCEVLLHEALNDTTYNHLITGLCKEKSYREAFGILDIMLEKNINPSVDLYSILISSLCMFHRFEKALELKEFMLRKESVSCYLVYYAMVNGLCREGKIELATLQFQEMMAKEISPDIDTYNVMIQGHCYNNNLRRVGELLSIMLRKNLSLSISSYRNLVRVMCICDRVLQALNLKEIIVRENKSPSIVVYNILIFQLLEIGKISLVTGLLDEIKRKDLIPDEVTYNFLICGYVKWHDISKSLEVLKSMIDEDLRPSNRSLRMVISQLCEHRNLNKALDLSSEMEIRGWEHGSIVQNAIVHGLLSHGRFQEAEFFLKRIEERGLIPKSISYDGLIKEFCQHGRLSIAVDLLDIMLKRQNLPSPTSYDSIIQGFCTHQAIDDVLNYHTEMLAHDLKPSIRSWDMLIHRLCADGRTVESERLLDSINQFGQTPSPSMYQAVIDRYSFENNHKKASELIHKMQQHGYVPDFKTHWSLVSNLSNSNKDSTESGGFLSKLLSLSGFTRKKDSKVG